MTNTRTHFISRRGLTRNQNITAFSEGRKLGPVAHFVILAVLLAVLGGLYLSQATRTSTFSYELNDIEQKRLDLASEKADLVAENSRLQSLSNIQNSAVAASMTTPVSTDYFE